MKRTVGIMLVSLFILACALQVVAQPGNQRGPGGRSGANSGVRLEPFVATTDANKSLRLKLLAVPELRTRYLRYVRDTAENWLDWAKLGPLVEKHRSLIGADVERDARKLYPTAEFTTGTFCRGDESPADAMTLKGFADKRRAFLLNHPEIKRLDPKTP
jgi:hypothetical protein